MTPTWNIIKRFGQPLLYGLYLFLLTLVALAGSLRLPPAQAMGIASGVWGLAAVALVQRSATRRGGAVEFDYR